VDIVNKRSESWSIRENPLGPMVDADLFPCDPVPEHVGAFPWGQKTQLGYSRLFRASLNTPLETTFERRKWKWVPNWAPSTHWMFTVQVRVGNNPLKKKNMPLETQQGGWDHCKAGLV
jgi:hypothetical protein